MRTTAQPAVNFFTRVSLETDERRRRLQARTGYSGPELVDEALQTLERALDEREPNASGAGAKPEGPGAAAMTDPTNGNDDSGGFAR
jgi:hypothetical protein